jgi:hypothetical protein
MRPFTLLDILILPRWFYRKISDKLLTVLIGTLIIGFADLLFYILSSWNIIFHRKSEVVLIYDAIILILIIIFSGLIKLVLFSIPLYDLLKRYRLEIDFFDGSNKLIKLMKIYIVAHVLLIILELILYYFIATNIIFISKAMKPYFVLIFTTVIIPIWFSGIITRGIKTVFLLKEKFNNLVFVIVFSWNFMIIIAFETICWNRANFIMKVLQSQAFKIFFFKI